MSSFELIADGLKFPEGPIALPDHGKTRETVTARVWAHPLAGAGELDSTRPRRLLVDRPGWHMVDALPLNFLNR